MIFIIHFIYQNWGIIQINYFQTSNFSLRPFIAHFIMFFYISSSNCSLYITFVPLLLLLYTIFTHFLLSSKLPTTISTPYLSIANCILSSILVLSVYNLNDIVKCLLFTRWDRIFGELRNFISRLSCVWILCSLTYYGMKSETAAQRIIIDF